MELVNISMLKENDYVNFINADKSLFLGIIKKIHNDYIGISIDAKQSNYVALDKNKSVEYIITFQHQALRCSSEVLGHKLSEEYHFILLNNPKIINKIERRQSERVQTVMDIEYCFLPNDVVYGSLREVPSVYFKRLRKTFTVDISSGGVRLIVYEDNNDELKNAIVCIKIKDEQIYALCSLARYEKMEDDKNNRAAFQYIDIANNHRQFIAKYVEEKLK